MLFFVSLWIEIHVKRKKGGKEERERRKEKKKGKERRKRRKEKKRECYAMNET